MERQLQVELTMRDTGGGDMGPDGREVAALSPGVVGDAVILSGSRRHPESNRADHGRADTAACHALTSPSERPTAPVRLNIRHSHHPGSDPAATRCRSLICRRYRSRAHECNGRVRTLHMPRQARIPLTIALGRRAASAPATASATHRSFRPAGAAFGRRRTCGSNRSTPSSSHRAEGASQRSSGQQAPGWMAP